MNLLDLMVKIGVDDNATAKVANIADGIGGKLATAAKVGAVAVTAATAAVTTFTTAVAGAVNQVADYGDEVDKTSQKLGVSAEAYQKWDYVLNISGTSMQNAKMGIKTLTNQLDEAKSGSAEAREKFEKLGISADQLQNMSREEAFEAAIRGFQGMADSTERAALANDLFGRSGQELTPLFNMTSEQTDELMQKAERLGLVMSDDAVKASAAFKDSLTTLTGTIRGARNALMAEFLPGLTTVMDGFAEVIGGDVDKGMQLIEDGVNELIERLDETLPKAIEFGGKVIGAIAKGLIDRGPDILYALLDGIVSVIEEMADNTDALVEGAMGFFGGILTALAKIAPRLLAAIAKLAVNLIISIVQHAPEMLRAALRLFNELVRGFADAAGRLLPMVGETLGNVLVQIGRFFQGLWDAGVNAGKNLIQGIIDGIFSGFKALGDTLGNVGKFIVDHKGPPEKDRKMLRPAGRLIMGGLIGGITDEIPALERAVGRVNGVIAVNGTMGAQSAVSGGRTALIAPERARERDLTVVLELDKMQLARAVYRLNEEETQRVGVRLAGGYA